MDSLTGVVKLKINYGSFYIPKYDPLKPKGDDAHFICPNQNVVGVEDGVGGRAKNGVDAGKFSRKLMKNCAAAVAKGTVDPTRVLQSAYSRTQKTPGSSTACVVALRDNKLYAANVGDSGVMVFRRKKLIYKSAVQRHYFNCPYQLEVGRRGGGEAVGRCWEGRTKVKGGDIVVVATDGLLDNVHVSEMESVLMEATAIGVEPRNLARRLAELSVRNSSDKRRRTPYAEAARKAGIKHYGGKIDDITVIVGHIIAGS